MDKLLFKKPPAKEVRVAVLFDPSFDVADDRSKFHNVIKAEFPIINIPELKHLTYDFGDYSVSVPDHSYRLEIGMNYFRLVMTNYAGFHAFRRMFVSSLGLFRRAYGIETFRSLTMQYSNVLPLESGHSFEDIFAFKIDFPNSLSSPLFTGNGLLAFQESGGFVTVQIEPTISGAEVMDYKLNLTFHSEQALDAKSVESLLDVANQNLYRYFVNFLQRSYLEYLLSR